MDNKLRISGIDVIGDIPWGTHIGLLYSSKKDYFEVIVPYIRSGLENNELCIFIYADNTSCKNLKGILSESIEGIDEYIKSGQLRLLSYKKWYLRQNNFNEVRLNRQWNQLIRYSLNKGYDGLRAAADTAWLEKSFFRSFSHYEHNINKIISELPFIAACLYDVNKLDTFEIAEIIKNHSYIITRHGNNLELIKNVKLLIKDSQIDELETCLSENRKLLNEALEYDKIKTEFLANIAHEFRTPLNVILSAVQLLKLHMDENYQDRKEDNKDSKYLKIIKQNCFRLLRLANNLIDIATIEKDFFELRLENYDIVSLVEKITMSVVEYASNKGIKLLFDTDIEEKTVACDPYQIERIILNLLSNAIKFTQSGGNIRVTVKDHGENISISVKDTGIGIPPDRQKYIFSRFHQVDKSFTRQQEGSGIGLSIVKALVEKHNGKITLKSILGKGSTFTIEIPCTTIEEPEDKSSNKNSIYKSSQIEQLNVEFSDIYL